MKHKITHRYTGVVLFEADIPDNTSSGLVVRAALEQATKVGANLAGAYLAGAYLDGAKLAYANLAGAYLAGAYLDGANLVGAKLAYANLVGAYLVGANLDGANLVGAKLDGANLVGANLDGANLVGERPIFQVGPIGSRSAYLVAYLTDQGVMLKTGCFIGSVESFKANLQAEHGDNQHAQEYRAALDLIDVHARLWAPKSVESTKAQAAATEVA